MDDSDLKKPKSWHCVRHNYITHSFERNIPISIVIENTGDKPSAILEYHTKLSPSFIYEQINSKTFQSPLVLSLSFNSICQ